MTSVRQRITDLAETSLNFTGKPSGLTVEQGRIRNLESTKLPHTNISLSQDDPEPRVGGHPQAVLRSFDLVLEHRVKAPAGTRAHVALDPLLVWGVKRVTNDERFGGLATKVDEGQTTFDMAEGGGVYGLARQTFKIWYTTAYSDLENPL